MRLSSGADHAPLCRSRQSLPHLPSRSSKSRRQLICRAPAYTPPPPPVFSWTGFYVGGNIGGGWGSRDLDYVANDPTSESLFTSLTGAPPPVSFTSSGVVGGLQLGYNWQLNRNWLVGLETDFDWSGIKGSTSNSGRIAIQGGGTAFTATADEHVKWFGTIRARLGYLPTDNLLAYITGGFAYGKVEHTGTYANSGPIGFSIFGPVFSLNCLAGTTCFSGSSNSTASGWTAGGGLEYAIWSRWTLRAEYLYISLDSNTITEAAVSVPPGSATPSINANFGRTNINVARVGVNYRF